jgi:hypothetical protein
MFEWFRQSRLSPSILQRCPAHISAVLAVLITFASGSFLTNEAGAAKIRPEID